MSEKKSVCDRPSRGAEDQLRRVQEQFRNFLTLLEQNNQVLKVIGDMEEKSQGDYLFDLNYIRSSLRDVRQAVREIIEQMIMLGGDRYEPLRARYGEIDAEIAHLLPDERPIAQTPFTMHFVTLRREHALSVGSKNAQLGEMKARLGLRVPDGFAITAWAYKHFLRAHGLQERIRSQIDRVDFRHYDDLVRVSDDVRSMVASSEVPRDLADEIQRAFEALALRCGSERVAMRSSGLGEDSLFSFAGQYATFLNVGPSDVIGAYRAVVASKFTPQAIYYFLSHALSEGDLAMSVGCVEMVDAAVSGVIYTRDPVDTKTDTVLIHAVLGLGEFLVDGTLTPDVFRLDRADGRVLEQQIAPKRVRLVMGEDGGTEEAEVPEREQNLASLDDEMLKQLAEIGERVEAHYGAPQDIEWAVDRRGRAYLLQTRPLRVIDHEPPVAVDVGQMRVLLSGGTTACPGAGDGPIMHVKSNRDLGEVVDGSVVVAPNPFPGLITVMEKARALVTEVGGVASHMATLAREYRIPTLVGASGATSLPAGMTVTVDATGGTIVEGRQPELIAARQSAAAHLFEDTPLFQGFKQILTLVAPLAMLHPSDPTFLPERCRTLHDITRYAHQKAMEEMFCRVSNLESSAQFGQTFVSELPLPLRVLFVDRPMDALGEDKVLSAEDLGTGPISAIWAGMREQGWPSGPTESMRTFPAAFATHGGSRNPDAFAVKSFAVLGESYMMLCLHLGYHFTTIEALCTEDANKNYIRMQYKDGGASLERRVRRIRLVASLLSHIGFDNASQADFLDATFTYADCETMREKLRLLGRITLMTKQLDMALSNDTITAWYTKDYLAKLGLVGG